MEFSSAEERSAGRAGSVGVGAKRTGIHWGLIGVESGRVGTDVDRLRRRQERGQRLTLEGEMLSLFYPGTLASLQPLQ